MDTTECWNSGSGNYGKLFVQKGGWDVDLGASKILKHGLQIFLKDFHEWLLHLPFDGLKGTALTDLAVICHCQILVS